MKGGPKRSGVQGLRPIIVPEQSPGRGAQGAKRLEAPWFCFILKTLFKGILAILDVQ